MKNKFQIIQNQNYRKNVKEIKIRKRKREERNHNKELNKKLLLKKEKFLIGKFN